MVKRQNENESTMFDFPQDHNSSTKVSYAQFQATRPHLNTLDSPDKSQSGNYLSNPAKSNHLQMSTTGSQQRAHHLNHLNSSTLEPKKASFYAMNQRKASQLIQSMDVINSEIPQYAHSNVKTNVSSSLDKRAAAMVERTLYSHSRSPSLLQNYSKKNHQKNIEQVIQSRQRSIKVGKKVASGEYTTADGDPKTIKEAAIEATIE